MDKALGGVIDEAYSLGDTEGRDSYSKEATDMLTAYLSEHPHDLICIVAGYKEALNKDFSVKTKDCQDVSHIDLILINILLMN